MTDRWTRPLSYDPLTGLKETFHFDHESDKWWIQTTQQATPIIDQNKRDQIANGKMGSGDMRHVARIPMVVYHRLLQEGITKDPKALKKFLNENGYLKTVEGNL